MEKAICVLCGEIGDLKVSRREKPFFRCDNCGAVVFANKELSMGLLEAQAVDDNSPGPEVTKSDSTKVAPAPVDGNTAVIIGELKAQKATIAELRKAVEAKAEPKAPPRKSKPKKERETAADYLFS